jgi:hypothetical protein
MEFHHEKAVVSHSVGFCLFALRNGSHGKPRKPGPMFERGMHVGLGASLYTRQQ